MARQSRVVPEPMPRLRPKTRPPPDDCSGSSVRKTDFEAPVVSLIVEGAHDSSMSPGGRGAPAFGRAQASGPAVASFSPLRTSIKLASLAQRIQPIHGLLAVTPES